MALKICKLALNVHLKEPAVSCHSGLTRHVIIYPSHPSDDLTLTSCTSHYPLRNLARKHASADLNEYLV